MEKNEAKPKPYVNEALKRIAIESKSIQDADTFNDFLIDAVHFGELRASHALYLYCKRYEIDEIKWTNMRLNDGSPRTAVVEFMDRVLENEGADMACLLYVVDRERREGRL